MPDLRKLKMEPIDWLMRMVQEKGMAPAQVEFYKGHPDRIPHPIEPVTDIDLPRQGSPDPRLKNATLKKPKPESGR